MRILGFACLILYIPVLSQASACPDVSGQMISDVRAMQSGERRFNQARWDQIVEAVCASPRECHQWIAEYYPVSLGIALHQCSGGGGGIKPACNYNDYYTWQDTERRYGRGTGGRKPANCP